MPEMPAEILLASPSFLPYNNNIFRSLSPVSMQGRSQLRSPSPRSNSDTLSVSCLKHLAASLSRLLSPTFSRSQLHRSLSPNIICLTLLRSFCMQVLQNCELHVERLGLNMTR